MRAQALYEQDRFNATLTLRYRKYAGPGFVYARHGDVDDPQYDSSLSFQQHSDRKTLSGIAAFNYDFDGAELTSISSYTVQDFDYIFDFDYLPINRLSAITVDPRKAKVLTQELRLTSKDKSKFDWIIGLYGQRLDNIQSIPSPIDVLILGGVVHFAPYYDRDLRQTDLAAYGTANLHLGSFTLGGGLRLLRTKYRADVIVTEGLPTGQVFTVSDTALLPKLSLSYKTPGDTLLYLNIAEGYESGKVSVDNNPITPYKAEKAWTFEAGVKGDMLDRVIGFEAAAFYINYLDKQVEDRFQDPVSKVIIETIRNLGDAESYGAEVNFTVRPARGLSFYANGSYLHTKWKKGAIFRAGAPDEEDISGEELPNSPHWSANFGGDLRKPVANNLEMSFHADASYMGRFRWRLPNLGQNYNPSYWVANARIGVGAEDGSWEIAARLDNIFDQRYFTEYSPGFFLSGTDLDAFNSSGVCPVGTPRCNLGAPAPRRRLVGSLALRF